VILVDLTDLERWDGVHGGTQRVVYGIAKELRRGADVGFIAYSNGWDRFVETSLDPVVERVERAPDTGTGSQPPAAPPRSAAYRLARRLRVLVPRAVRGNPRLRAAAYRALQRLRRAAARLRPAPAPAPGPEAYAFQPDDVVLVLGKPWDEPGLQARLDAEKERVGFRVVELVYDMVIPLQPHLHHPTLFVPYTRQMFLQAQGADRLLAISESTRRDFEAFCARLALDCPPIDVIRLADRLESGRVPAEDDDLPLPDGVAEEFVLCVGTVEVRKNHALLYETWRLAAERGVRLPQLVIVGARGWLVEETWNLLTRDPAVRDSIRILTSVDDAVLARLYRRCRCTVYPSRYEGWGLPVAESLAYGKPVAASSAASIPEIGGDLVRYFSPHSADECLAALAALTDPRECAAAAARIAERYVPTSWAETAAAVRASIARLDPAG